MDPLLRLRVLFAWLASRSSWPQGRRAVPPRLIIVIGKENE